MCSKLSHVCSGRYAANAHHVAELIPAAELVSKTGSRDRERHLHASQLGDRVEVDALEVALVRHGRQLPPPGEGQRVRHMAQRGRQHCRRQCLYSRKASRPTTYLNSSSLLWQKLCKHSTLNSCIAVCLHEWLETSSGVVLMEYR